MNDEDVLTMVKQSAPDASMQIPAAAIKARGDRLRMRRRLLRSTAAGAAAAVIGSGLFLYSIGASGRGSNMLTAWSIRQPAAGTVQVTVRELSDPSGLQSRLRADGVPITVRFGSQDPPSCLDYNDSAGLLGRIFSVPASTAANGLVVDIHPPEIPAGLGLWLEVSSQTGSSSGYYAVRATVVKQPAHAGAHCAMPSAG
jgi:hypothetical protein